MTETAASVALMLAAVFTAACSQLLLKKAAGAVYKNRLAEYLNPRVITAYGLFTLSALGSFYALRFIPLSLMPVLESSGYVFMAALSYIFLRERLNKRQLGGMALIIAGIVLFNL